MPEPQESTPKPVHGLDEVNPYSSPRHAGPLLVTREPMFVHTKGVIGLATLLFVISLGCYTILHETRVARSETTQDIRDFTIGIPHWLQVLRIKAETPGFRGLPGYTSFIGRSWSVDYLSLAMSISICVAIAASVYALCPPLRHVLVETTWTERTWYLLVIAPGIFISPWIPTKPIWISAALYFTVMPVCLVIAAVKLRSYAHAVLLPLTGVIALWWSSRVVDIFWTRSLSPRSMDAHNILEFLVVVTPLLVVSITSVSVVHWMDRKATAQNAITILPVEEPDEAPSSETGPQP